MNFLHKIRNIFINIFVHAIESEKSNFVNYLYFKSQEKTYEVLGERISKSLLFKDKYRFWDFLILNTIKNINENKSFKDNAILEFGVGRGVSIKYFSERLKKNELKIAGFDSFDGNPDVWPGTDNMIGASDQSGKIPKNLKSNVEIIKGLIENTLEEFLIKKQIKKIAFVHIDVNIYSASSFILKKLKPYFKKNTIILFDELVNYPFWWLNGDYKALKENFNDDEYEFIEFDRTKRAAIKIIKLN